MKIGAFDVEITGVAEVERDLKGKFLPNLHTLVRRGLIRAVQAGEQVAKSLVPVSKEPKGTHLRDEIRTKDNGYGMGGSEHWEAEAELVADKEYAGFVDSGTAPHVIEAKGRALAFDWNGVPTFLKRVHHPGTQPHPFMGPAWLKIESKLSAETELAVDEAVQQFNRGG
jgi:hypothetical protein